MNRLVIALVLTLASSAAIGQSRPSTVNRPCAVNRQSVVASGAVVLGTGGYTYDRFVRNRGFCQFDEYTEPAWVESRDTPACFIGYRCKSGPYWDD